MVTGEAADTSVHDMHARTLSNAPEASADGTTMMAIYQVVRTEILSGALEGGERFSQVQLAKRLGVSRTPLREALRLLEREGLVESSQNKQARVTEMDVDSVDDLYGARIAIECLAVALSLPHRTPSDVTQVRRLVDEMDRVAAGHDTLTWEIPHAAFHEALFRHSGRRPSGLACELRDHSQMYRSRVLSEPLAWTVASREHREIAEAFELGRVRETVILLAKHYARTALTLIARMDPGYEPVRVRAALRLAEAGTWSW